MEALTFVQADLNACGLARYCMQLVTSGTDVDGVPEVMAATSDGSFWGGSSYRVEYLAEQVADALWTVAASVQDTLLEVERVIFPACAKHGGRPAEPGIPLPADGWPE